MVRLNADPKERELDLRARGGTAGNKIAVIENLDGTEAAIMNSQTLEEVARLEKDRITAAEKFYSKEAEEEAKKVSAKAYTPVQVVDAQDTTNEEQGPKVVTPTAAQITALKAAIVNSQTLEVVARLEKALSTGQIPAEFAIPKPDTNMAEASEEIDTMDTDGQNQENGADKQKQNEESTQERMAAAEKFHSKEADKEAKKVSAKAYTPVRVVDAQDTTKQEQGPKVIAPTAAQFTAIKAAIVNCQTLEKVARLEKDDQDEEDEADELKQNEERTPIQVVTALMFVA